MKKYKVLVSGLLLKNNTIADGGSVVKENQLINAIDAVKGKFVEEVKGSDDDGPVDYTKLGKAKVIVWASENGYEIDESLDAKGIKAQIKEQIDSAE